jgi:hypothetical protein
MIQRGRRVRNERCDFGSGLTSSIPFKVGMLLPVGKRVGSGVVEEGPRGREAVESDNSN